MGGTEEPAEGSYFVGKRDELIAAKRSCITIEDRDILVIHHRDSFYAIDSYCYREFRTLKHATKNVPDTFYISPLCCHTFMLIQLLPPCCEAKDPQSLDLFGILLYILKIPIIHH